LEVDIKGANLLLNSNATRGFEEVITIMSWREKISDYFFYSIDWDCVEGHNVRMTTLGQMDQLVWEYSKDGILTFPVPQPDRIDRLRECSYDQRLVLWPNLDPFCQRFGCSSAQWDVLIEEVRQAVLKVEQAEANGETEIDWITENPGQQWSGTFRPMVTALTWYHADDLKPLRIGIPHPVYSLLRCAQKRGQAAFRFANFDTLEFILIWVCKLMVADVERVLFGQ
jgi:hypothetical protein